MRKFIFLGASLILLGAGCSNATPESQSNNSVQQPVVQQQQEQQPIVQDQKPQPVATAATTTPTQPVKQPSQPKPTPVATIPSYTMAEVAVNNSASKCWTVVSGNVYDVTNFAPKHPGGKESVLKLCGKDGTSAFTQKHGGQEKPEAVLAGLKIGVLK
jgi:cytochrome b involved in lipid metabolism